MLVICSPHQLFAVENVSFAHPYLGSEIFWFYDCNIACQFCPETLQMSLCGTHLKSGTFNITRFPFMKQFETFFFSEMHPSYRRF